MATQNRDGLTVRYGLEQAPDITVAAMSHFEKGYSIEIAGPGKEQALDMIVPKGTLLGEVLAVLPVEPFDTSVAGTVTVKLVKASDGGDLETLLNANTTANLNAGSIEGAPMVLTEDAKFSVTVTGDIGTRGVCKFVVSAITGA